GLADPVLGIANLDDADEDTAPLRDLLVAWNDCIGQTWITAADVRAVTMGSPVSGIAPPAADKRSQLAGAIEAIDDRYRASVVGKWVDRRKGKVVGGLRFEASYDKHRKIWLYRVVPAQVGGTP